VAGTSHIGLVVPARLGHRWRMAMLVTMGTLVVVFDLGLRGGRWGGREEERKEVIALVFSFGFLISLFHLSRAMGRITIWSYLE